MRRRFGKPADHGEHRVDLILEFFAQACLPRFVVVDLMVDLGDRQPVKTGRSSPGACRSSGSNVAPVLVERHGIGRAGLDFGSTAFDLVIPGLCRVGIVLAVQAADQLERQLGTLLGREAKDLRQDIGCHNVVLLADGRQAYQVAGARPVV